MAASGTFVWYELLTPDKEGALAFYATVVGWTGEDAGQPGLDYTFLTVDGARIGGVHKLPDEPGVRPGWFGYVGVADADEAAGRVEAKGGRILRAPQDIPGDHGRFAVLADPQGAVFEIIAPPKDHANPEHKVHRPGVPGFGGWHELYTDDQEAAFDFYSSVFGWTKDQAVDLGEHGVYQLFAIDGVQSGGIAKRPPNVPAPGWNYYFNVEAIDAAVDRIRESGGQIVVGPLQVPGGSWIVGALDPQSVLFSLVSRNK